MARYAVGQGACEVCYSASREGEERERSGSTDSGRDELRRNKTFHLENSKART